MDRAMRILVPLMLCVLMISTVFYYFGFHEPRALANTSGVADIAKDADCLSNADVSEEKVIAGSIAGITHSFTSRRISAGDTETFQVHIPASTLSGQIVGITFPGTLSSANLVDWGPNNQYVLSKSSADVWYQHLTSDLDFFYTLKMPTLGFGPVGLPFVVSLGGDSNKIAYYFIYNEPPTEMGFSYRAGTTGTDLKGSPATAEYDYDPSQSGTVTYSVTAGNAKLLTASTAQVTKYKSDYPKLEVDAAGPVTLQAKLENECGSVTSTVATTFTLSATTPTATSTPTTSTSTSASASPTASSTASPTSSATSSSKPTTKTTSTKSATPTASNSGATATPTTSPTETPTISVAPTVAQTTSSIIDTLSVGGAVTNPTSSPSVTAGQSIHLTSAVGAAKPGEVVTISVYSTPKTYTVTADATGTWSIDIPTDSLVAGDHHITYATATVPETQLLAFSVAPQPAAQSFLSIHWQLIAGIIGGLVVLIGFLIAWKLHHRHSVSQEVVESSMGTKPTDTTVVSSSVEPEISVPDPASVSLPTPTPPDVLAVPDQSSLSPQPEQPDTTL